MICVDIYCRVSTDIQEDNTSLEEQERCAREYCQEHGLIVGMVHREVWSGYEYRERDKLSLMRERYQSGKIQGVVVRTYDRLSRKEVHFGILLEEMEHLGVELHCVKENLDDSLLGRMTRLFLGFLAEWEWEKIRERTTTGRINRAKEGKIVAGRKLPYGWQWQYGEQGEKETVMHHPEQVCHVRWMADQYDNGLSTLEIARQLTNNGVLPPDGDTSKAWHPFMVRRILSNERLIGKGKNFAYQMHQAKQPFDPIDLPDGTYPPIIDEEQFYRIQDKLSRTSQEAPRNNERPEEFLVRAGYVKCGYCGRSMQAHIDRRKRQNHPGEDVDRFVYRCNRRDRKGNILCQIGQDVLSKAVDAWVDEQLLTLAEHTALIAKAIKLASNEGKLTADAKAIDASLITWQKRAQNYMEDLADPSLRGDSRASIRQSFNAANKRIEELLSERNQVLLGLIDREREQAAY
jgi:site-specific DNA recombinase